MTLPCDLIIATIYCTRIGRTSGSGTDATAEVNREDSVAVSPLRRQWSDVVSDPLGPHDDDVNSPGDCIRRETFLRGVFAVAPEICRDYGV